MTTTTRRTLPPTDLPCSHERSVDLFTESIGSPLTFPSCQKKSWHDYIADGEECSAENRTFMGEHIPTTYVVFVSSTHSTRYSCTWGSYLIIKFNTWLVHVCRARGVFYLRTGSKRPFGHGAHMDVIMPNIPNVRRNRIMFDITHLRLHSLNTAGSSQPVAGTRGLHPHPRSRSRPASASSKAGATEHVITTTETNYSPSNGTNLILYPSYLPYTPGNYPNNQVLRHCLLLARVWRELPNPLCSLNAN